MGRIHYSLAGEGRGHAVRARTVVEHLRRRHDVTVHAPADAYDFLAPLYAGTDVRVERIPGLCFAYRGERLDLPRTIAGAARYALNLPREVRRLSRRLRRERVDLVVTDFEPSLPRAAKLAGVPFVSLDHQHFLTTVDLSALPFGLRAWSWIAGLVVRAYYWGEAASIVSSFHGAPPRPGARHAHHVGVLLRPELVRRAPTRAGHLLVYLRRQVSENVLAALANSPLPVRLYGLGERAPRGAIAFRAVDEEGFLDDLASCEAVVSTSGNQLVGEALAFAKPVLAMPEPGNREQEINGCFLAASGAGRVVAMERFDEATLRAFLGELEALRAHCGACRPDGTARTLALLEGFLRETPARARRRAALRPALESS
ncbi:MAG: glycosyltransferase [Planctomycetes bacterium]|nr:glycosyltransferase [Planctomycetota bacterium]